MSSQIEKNIMQQLKVSLFSYRKFRTVYLNILFICSIFLVVLPVLNISKANAQDNIQLMKLEVIDPFIEMHSGPAKGYPVFYTVEQGETIIILSRRTGWYQLKTETEQIGWAAASQVARTLLPTGVPVDLPTVSYGDYLKNSWRVGFKLGSLSGDNLQGSDTFSYSVGYRPLSWLAIELETLNFYETEIKGQYDSFNVLFEPYSDWVVSPVLSIGVGKMNLESQPELATLYIDKKTFRRIGLSGNYYIGRNFLINLGYQSYYASTAGNNERLDQWQLGFNAFF